MRRNVIGVVVAVVAVVAATAVIDVVLNRIPVSNLSSAIQASSTLVLVSITAVYALLTGDMVRLQQQDIRRREVVPDVKKLLSEVVDPDLDRRLFHATRLFPVELSQPPDPELVPTIEGTWLDDHLDVVSPLIPLLPSPLQTTGQSYRADCHDIARNFHLLADALLQEQTDAVKATRKFDWSQCRQDFNKLRDQLTISDRPEWEELVGKTLITRLQSRRDNLTKQLQAYLGSSIA